MIRFIKRKIQELAIRIVRRSAYYQDLNKTFHELWCHTKLFNNDIDFTRLHKDSLYGKCLNAAEKKHKRHYDDDDDD